MNSLTLLILLVATVQAHSRFLMDPQNTTVDEGQSVTLSCQLEYFDYGTTCLSYAFYWRRTTSTANGEYVADCESVEIAPDRITASKNNGQYVLNIRNVRPEDAGEYWCSVYYSLFYSYTSETARVTVNFTPLDVVCPKDLSTPKASTTSSKGTRDPAAGVAGSSSCSIVGGVLGTLYLLMVIANLGCYIFWRRAKRMSANTKQQTSRGRERIEMTYEEHRQHSGVKGEAAGRDRIEMTYEPLQYSGVKGEMTYEELLQG